MTDSMRDRLRDELAGWPIGSGYYSTAVSVDDARDMADAVLAELQDLPDDVIEQMEARFKIAWHEADDAGLRGRVKAGLRAAFGGEQDADES